MLEDFKVYSFYSYEENAFLLNMKYDAIGSRIYKILAQRASEYFFNHLSVRFPKDCYGVGIDDDPKKGYSHTGIILKGFSSKIKPIFGELRAKNKVKYAGESLSFRKKNPKNFKCKVSYKDLIIFDDIITTGTSMLEAREKLQKYNNNVLFGIVLSDARS
ncbi:MULTISPECIES: phosphoribosyltransferase [unclassified Helicobacter]|uniref:phosphoribosyltransferase n=1 Tax=unclassified Helicobacter TaxID=2593540 RepID=UPI0013150C60|nr:MULTISPECIES: ComF family protein [unclassified Helicobacter]